MAESILKPLRYTFPNEKIPTCGKFIIIIIKLSFFLSFFLNHLLYILETVTLVNKIWPYNNKQPSPDIVICTPALLTSFLRGPHILNIDIFINLRTLVLDEVISIINNIYYINIIWK